MPGVGWFAEFSGRYDSLPCFRLIAGAPSNQKREWFTRRLAPTSGETTTVVVEDAIYHFGRSAEENGET